LEAHSVLRPSPAPEKTHTHTHTHRRTCDDLINPLNTVYQRQALLLIQYGWSLVCPDLPVWDEANYQFIPQRLGLQPAASMQHTRKGWLRCVRGAGACLRVRVRVRARVCMWAWVLAGVRSEVAVWVWRCGMSCQSYVKHACLAHWASQST
jgi:hypothetical protein